MDKGVFQHLYECELDITKPDLFVVYANESQPQNQTEVLVMPPCSPYINRYNSIADDFVQLIHRHGKDKFIKSPGYREFMHTWGQRKYLFELLKGVPADEMTTEMQQTLQQHFVQLG